MGLASQRILKGGKNMNFEIGQIFEGEYPPEAAVFCNSRGDCYIDEIEPEAFDLPLDAILNDNGVVWPV